MLEISEGPGTGGPTTTLTNVTFAENEASQLGGAIMLALGDLELVQVTIAHNTADEGAGIYVETEEDFDGAYLRSTIVAFNNTSVDVPANCFGDVYSLGYNLTNTTCFTSGPGNIINTDPMLGSYGSHGSMNGTHTYALLPGSPAIDAADPTIGPTDDQRGRMRPWDGDQDGTAIADIGAFEFQLELFLPLILR